MEGELVHELEVSAAASVVWDIYGTLELSKLMCKFFPYAIENVEVVEGDGGVGTILDVMFLPGASVFTSYKEKFTKIDNKKRLKEVEVVEGGYLDVGFSLYRMRLEILQKETNSCVVKSTIEFKVDTAANASIVSIQALELIAGAVAKHLSEQEDSCISRCLNVCRSE